MKSTAHKAAGDWGTNHYNQKINEGNTLNVPYDRNTDGAKPNNVKTA